MTLFLILLLSMQFELRSAVLMQQHHNSSGQKRKIDTHELALYQLQLLKWDV
jgi:hypothetical protein